MSGLWLLAALLVLHWGAALGNAKSLDQLDPTREATGTLSAEVQTSAPAVQPRDVPRSIVAEALNQITKRDPTSNGESPSGLVPIGLDVSLVLPAECPWWAVHEYRPSIAQRNFEARAPPSSA